MNFISWLLGFDRVRSIDSIDFSLSAPWAADRGLLVFGCCMVGIVTSSVFYARFEEKRSTFVARLLTAIRATLLVLLVLTLAAPLVRSSATMERRPRVLVVIDNTESMNLADAKLPGMKPIRRADRVVKLAAGEKGFFGRLEAQRGYELTFATFSGDEQRPLETMALADLAGKLTCSGTRTDLAAVIQESAARTDVASLGAVLFISDFAHNGSTPLSPSSSELVDDFPVPIWTIGVGRINPADISVAIRGETKAKLGEPTSLQIDLLQQGLTDQLAEVTLHAHALTRAPDKESITRLVYSSEVALSQASHTLDVPFTPDVAGPIELTAAVKQLGGELLHQNNTTGHRIEVIADHLRLMFVEHEPAWEWRFIKEVFHRDKLVGLDGFRTYLGSADKAVRQTNSLFLPELAASRAEFFNRDVVLLGDVPAETLTPDFCSMLEEFVGDFGGGLVVLAGPRFGPTQLLDTPIAGMLPVRLDAASELQDKRDFALRRTSTADQYPFMTLADSASENDRAWRSLEKLPWYFPSASVHEQADVLAEHPNDLCSDGETHQPLIAIRPYGNGQVVYVAFNELWRLRSGIGQKCHQRFWSQLIYRLGMSHPVGGRKRFVVRLDDRVFRVGGTATLTVDAFDEDFQPLDRELSAKLFPPESSGLVSETISLTRNNASRYEVAFDLSTPGEYRLEIADAVADEIHQEVLRVSAASVELQNPARDAELQSMIAERTGGRACHIDDAEHMLDNLRLQAVMEREERAITLWHTPLWFVLVAGLMLSEWTVRRWVHLP
ncbi:MAG: hypothetical protein CMJ64_28520 [Planctomycetaceae bacterium]|nr:hypothetical protein [Planctomycetaceae bacterium]